MKIKNIYFLLFLCFIASSCSTKLHLASAEVKGYEMTDDLAAPDAEVAALIAPYKNQVDAKMDEVIGEVATVMEKGKPESTLGNWVADAIFEMTNQKVDEPIDFALQNYGGIRIGAISKGPLTVRKIYELMPFDNLISIMEVEGAFIDSLVTRYAQSGGAPISRQLTFTIKDNQPLDVKISGEPINYTQTYRFALPDYVANGGDRMSFLKPLERTDLDYYIRDALLDYARYLTAQSKNIQSGLDGRIKILED